MVSPQNQNPIVAIENVVLPSDFSVEVASKNVRTREKTGGDSMTQPQRAHKKTKKREGLVQPCTSEPTQTREHRRS